MKKVFDRILITGGAGFIGGSLIRRLLLTTNSLIFNIDNLSYSSDLKSINKIENSNSRHFHLNINLNNLSDTNQAVKEVDPDIVLHLAAESHVDRSLDQPINFIESNIVGTFNLLEAVKSHWINLPHKRRKIFRFLHVSTDEVFGSLASKGFFNESSSYSPRSPYSATKAASDHLVEAWHHSFGIPTLITNCSNNYGPFQFPEKLIPITILKAFMGETIPIYGTGQNIRDWLHVEDHIEALLLVAEKGEIGKKYCIGGLNERTNNEVVRMICKCLDNYKPRNKPHSKLIEYVEDRPGHDKRYAIDPSFIKEKLGWEPKINFSNGIDQTVRWYLKNIDWCHKIQSRSGYKGERIGLK